MGKVISTLVTVIVAVAVSAGVWILANQVLNQVRRRWKTFNALAFAVIGFIIGALLSGNHLTVGSPSGDSGGFLAFIWLPVAAAIVVGVLAWVLEQIDEPRLRLIVSTVAGVGIGVAIALLIREQYRPGLEWVGIVGWTVGVAVLAVIVDYLRRKPLRKGILTGAAIGMLLGGWGLADLGAGSIGEAILATAIPAGLLGARFGLTTNPDSVTRSRIDQRSRAVVFIGPALLFIFATLLVPAIRTFYLSFLDADSEEFVKADNYIDTFKDKSSWDASNWTNMFTSRLFWVGLVLLAFATAVGVANRRRSGKAVELGNSTMAPLLGGILFTLFAVFTVVRGTIPNNLWWVVTVVFASTAMGLAVAVLADRSKHEKIAKSFIFMPLALSLVGASVIWRFMYQPRDASVEQTGLMNAAWVGLGKLSTGTGLPTIVVAIVAGAIWLALLVFLARALVRRQWGRAALPAVGAILVGWFFLRYIGSGVGGVVKNADGEYVANPIAFVQESPFNNVWLMVILIWLQTGFAMVILSAAIKAVPDEIIEAARVDGASPSQIFWRVTLPQIATTIGVIVTTLIVLVMKVFDIVKVVTNGNFDTQVLANDMFQKSFNDQNYGRGSALAILILLSVLPVMIFNIRKMQREA